MITSLIDTLNPYAYLMMLRRLLYHKGTLRSVKVDVPVLSVGNITVGGSGKSPLTAHIAAYLRDELHKKPAIVMRGYKRRSKGLLVVSDGRQIQADVDASGDEAQVYARYLPGVIVICDEHRVRGARQAIALGADCIILDDGFQHLQLKRDLDIVIIDKHIQSPILPFGRKREHRSALSDADMLVQAASITEKLPNVPLFHLTTTLQSIRTVTSGSSIEISGLHGMKVLAVSSIANPERFHQMLASYGANVETFVLPDHSSYDMRIITDIHSKAIGTGAEVILTTTKDIVKSEQLFRSQRSETPVAVVSIGVTLDKSELFFNRIQKIIQ